MKNETTNTRKTVLQPDGKSPVDKTSRSATKDGTVSMRRRKLLKGLGAVPVVITLHSGAAMAASSTGACVGPRGLAPQGCLTGTGGDHDNFLRTLVNPDGTVPGWDQSITYPGYDPGSDANQCLVSVDENGVVITNEVIDERVVLISCWNSFT